MKFAGKSQILRFIYQKLEGTITYDLSPGHNYASTTQTYTIDLLCFCVMRGYGCHLRPVHGHNKPTAHSLSLFVAAAAFLLMFSLCVLWTDALLIALLEVVLLLLLTTQRRLNVKLGGGGKAYLSRIAASCYLGAAPGMPQAS